MVFSSITFLFLFLPITLVLYYLRRDITWKNVILLIMSLVFYAWGEPVYVILMIISILLNYYVGLDIDRHYNKKAVLIVGIVMNLLILGYFKYSGFVVDTINNLTGMSLKNRELPLPIGISFYTFQAMSYLIDVYRGKCKAQRSILSFAVYITMFPQLIAGPIVRYEDIEAQLNNRMFRGKEFTNGTFIFIKGLVKKVVFANVIGELHHQIMALQTPAALTAWIGAIAFTLQIFNDFSGYSDMAIGLGGMLGFKFPVNFNHPYGALSVTDFWRKWHISLGTWFREYVYIPLGGNRKGVARHIINLLIVWALTGLWHGASWNFVVWGLYYGIILILEKYLFKKIKDKLPVAINWIITFLIVIIGWVFFFAESLPDAMHYLKNMFGASGVFADGLTGFYAGSYAIIFVLAFVPSAINADRIEKRIPVFFKWVIYACLFSLAIAFLIGESYNPFLYFRF